MKDIPQGKRKTILGSFGAGIMALCCFTPILVIAVTALGAASIISYLDYILLPSLVFFLCLTGIGLYQMKKQKKDCFNTPSEGQKEN